MKLVGAAIYAQYQPFRDGPYRCRGQSEEGFESTILRLETDTGLVGWGEFAPLGSFYSEAFASGARAGLAELLPGLLGCNPLQIADVNCRMDHVMLGQPYVKSAIDMACWDLLGHATGQSLATLLGGRFTDSTALYRSVSQDEPGIMVARALKYVAEGYRRIQVKVGDDPLVDAQRMRAVRAALDDEVLLLADANGAWTLAEALRFTTAMADADYYLEQPCAELDENIALGRHCRQPMLLDESIKTPADLLAAAAAGVSGVTIKVSRVGGITRARLLRDLAVARRMKVCIEDTGGSDIDSAATILMMVSMPRELQMHTVDFMNWVDASNGKGIPQPREGRMLAPRGPGLGIETDPSQLGQPLAVF
ncbi:MAG: mandelate racemase/muconate lactonizing enzyme family protein [Gammaproteobacteria bacterium]|nr:mandelate racemase/muconate lactonizing enzyme family protein [Gammaproteobacteria bacterium]